MSNVFNKKSFVALPLFCVLTGIVKECYISQAYLCLCPKVYWICYIITCFSTCSFKTQKMTKGNKNLKAQISRETVNNYVIHLISRIFSYILYTHFFPRKSINCDSTFWKLLSDFSPTSFVCKFSNKADVECTQSPNKLKTRSATFTLYSLMRPARLLSCSIGQNLNLSTRKLLHFWGLFRRFGNLTGKTPLH